MMRFLVLALAGALLIGPSGCGSSPTPKPHLLGDSSASSITDGDPGESELIEEAPAASGAPEPVWLLTKALIDHIGRSRNVVLDKIGDPLNVYKEVTGARHGLKQPFYDVYDYYNDYDRSGHVCAFVAKLGERQPLPAEVLTFFDSGSNLECVRWTSKHQQGSLPLTRTLRAVLPTVFPGSRPKDYTVWLSETEIAGMADGYTSIEGFRTLPDGAVVRFTAKADSLLWLRKTRRLDRQTQEFKVNYELQPGATRWIDGNITHLDVIAKGSLLPGHTAPAKYRPVKVVRHPAAW